MKFALNDGVKIEEWKTLSDKISSDMKGTDGLQFRESAVDEKGNVYCILKWDTIEQRTVFFDNMQKDFKENPEKMAGFGKIADMKTMEMNVLTVV
ncbi:MAG: hypothetical protein Q9M97_09645 [Candidatus Gracilibacteria bacterium]|nr:hypothetical protein [Candidatus Gracilibacteria bacterium]